MSITPGKYEAVHFYDGRSTIIGTDTMLVPVDKSDEYRDQLRKQGYRVNTKQQDVAHRAAEAARTQQHADTWNAWRASVPPEPKRAERLLHQIPPFRWVLPALPVAPPEPEWPPMPKHDCQLCYWGRANVL